MYVWIADPRVVLIVFLSFVLSSPAFGGDPVVNRGTNVAVIDMAKVLRDQPRLQFALADLKKLRNRHEARVAQERRDLDAQTAELDTLDVDSPERSRRQQEIETAMAELELSDQHEQQEFAKLAARMHLQAYSEIQDLVKRFALRYGIDLVLNFDSSDVEPDNAEKITRRLQDHLLFQSSLNITSYMMAGGREVGPSPVKRYPPGTKVFYAKCIPGDFRSPSKYALPRKAADRLVSIANQIQPRPKPVRLAPYNCAPLGTFTIGDSSFHLLRDSVLVDPSFQSTVDPILKKLVDILRENKWKMDDRVFQAWISEFDTTNDIEKQKDETVE